MRMPTDQRYSCITTAFSSLAVAIIISNYLPSLTLLWVIAILLMLIAIAHKLLSRKLVWLTGFKQQQWLTVTPLAMAVGISWGGIAWHHLLSWSLPKELIGITTLAEGYVEDIPIRRPDYTSFILHLTTLDSKPAHSKIALKWYHNHTGRPAKLTAGDYWQLAVKLKAPIATLNPGARDQERAWAIQGVRAVGYVVTNTQRNRFLNRQATSQIINRWRTQAIKQLNRRLITTTKFLESLIKKYLPLNHVQWNYYQQLTQTSRAIILSLTLGYHQTLSNNDWHTISLAGIGHLLAISGLHISLVAYATGLVVSILINRHPTWILLFSKPKLVSLISLIISGGYALITGWSIATQRAWLMLLINTIATFNHYPLSALTIWWITLVIITVIHPLAALQIGFWLSFAASFIMLTLHHWHNLSSKHMDSGSWHKLTTLQFDLLLTLTPLNLWFFKQITLLGIITNPIVIPVVTIIVLPATLLALLSHYLQLNQLTNILNLLAMGILQLVWWLVDLLTRHNQWLRFSYSINDLGILISCIIALAVLSMRYTTRYRCYWLWWLLPLVLLPSHRPTHNGEFWVNVLDVGQGLAVIVSTKHHLLIYDTGPGSNYGNSGDKIIVPFMLNQHLGPLDLLVVSHGDKDHAGGADSVIKLASPQTILTSAPQLFTEHHNVKQCHAGQRWQWDDVTFTMLHPEIRMKTNTSSNNRSCVLKVANRRYSVLLTGDIEHSSERTLLSQTPAQLPSNILISPHHGSATSSTAAFIKQVAPRYVVFTTGYRNRFRLPNQHVLDRYRQKRFTDTQLWNTAYSGTLTFRVSDKDLEVESYRQKYRRIWHNIRQQFNQIEW